MIDKRESGTPRTDAAEDEHRSWVKYAEQYGHFPEAMEQAPDEADPFFIARQLERELSEARRDAELYRLLIQKKVIVVKSDRCIPFDRGTLVTWIEHGPRTAIDVHNDAAAPPAAMEEKNG